MRIAIVNDVPMSAEAVRRVIAGSRDDQVAWVAQDGEEAVTRCAADKPDLVLMDLIMPRLDGVEATRQIMANSPCPVVVVTASVNDNSSKVFEAMGAGALDAVNTPVSDGTGANEGGRALIRKIETIRKLIGQPGNRRGSTTGDTAPAAAHMHARPLVAIGASAGGPAALAKIVTELPADFAAPIVVVQHVDAQFAKGLATWLGYYTRLRVRLAEDGEPPVAGTVLLAGADLHLCFSAGGRLCYEEEPFDVPYRPSIDAFFNSLAFNWPGEVIGVLLTGMGRDGAQGLRCLRASGHHTIAQDRPSSTVYGMPKAALEMDAVSEVLPLGQIAPRLIELAGSKAKMHV